MCSREEENDEAQKENAIVGGGKDVELQLPVVESEEGCEECREAKESTKGDTEHRKQKNGVDDVGNQRRWWCENETERWEAIDIEW